MLDQEASNKKTSLVEGRNTPLKATIPKDFEKQITAKDKHTAPVVIKKQLGPTGPSFCPDPQVFR